ncbi:MAG: hypothetical protein S4CHLAM45_03110 [Chlamydiales bacterium]|nr:hypothetical protein [Chlamydiales bacterium]MCH9619169.1 hypothetical protein [Chlamydiales bacterium]MCH9622431.1 hypothetical protein [Chlamydiales bacterium]
MKRFFVLTILFCFCFSPYGFCVDDTFFDYQNYNHGYCPDCNYCPCRCDVESCPSGNPSCPPQKENYTPPYPKEPTPCPPTESNAAPCAPTPCATTTCDPCAPVCGAECGISVCAITVAIAAVAAAAAIIVASSNGAGSVH